MSDFTLVKGRENQARASLYERYDRINALYERAEKRLAESHIPRDVDFIFEDELFDEFNPGMGSLYHSLGMHRVKGKWRIVYGCHTDQMPYPSEWTPIVECSAAIRSDAAHHLDALRVTIVEAAEAFIPQVDEAIAALERFTDPKPSDEIKLALNPPKVGLKTRKLRR